MQMEVVYLAVVDASKQSNFLIHIDRIVLYRHA